MSDVLLSLDTLVVRPKISIDGKNYEILSPDELPVLTSHLLASRGKRMEELMAKSELDDNDRDELAQVVRQIADTIMEPVPREVRDKLTDPQRNAVTEAFSMLLLSRQAGTAAANLKSLLGTTAGALLKQAVPDARSRQTGDKSSPGSSASTAARRAGGSGKRRSRS